MTTWHIWAIFGISYCMSYTASGGGDCDDRDARDEVWLGNVTNFCFSSKLPLSIWSTTSQFSNFCEVFVVVVVVEFKCARTGAVAKTKSGSVTRLRLVFNITHASKITIRNAERQIIIEGEIPFEEAEWTVALLVKLAIDGSAQGSCNVCYTI